MKKAFVIVILACNILFAINNYSINNSKLINGNVLVFQSSFDSNKILKLPVKDGNILFDMKYRQGKANALKNFLSNIYSVPSVLNLLAKTKNLDKNKKIIVGYKNLLYYCTIKTAFQERDTPFDSMVDVVKIYLSADKVFDLDTFRSKKTYGKAILSISKDEENNIYALNIFGNSYRLKYVTNKHLHNFLKIKKELIKKFNFDNEPIIVKYFKKTDEKFVIRTVTYEKNFENNSKATIVTIKDIDRKSRQTNISTAMLYDINKKNILFQLKGKNIINSNELYSFIQYPQSMIVKVRSNGSDSNYYRKSIYYYNKAGIWYLLSWLKNKKIDKKSAYVFYGNSDAKLFTIRKKGDKYSINSHINVSFIPNSSVIQEYGNYRFIDATSHKIDSLKKRFNIVEIVQ